MKDEKKTSMAKELQAREVEMENISQMPWLPSQGQFLNPNYEHVSKFPGQGNVFRLPAHLRKELTKPFPREAIKDYRSKSGTLSTIRAQYIFERLNSVFGVMGWTTEQKIVGIFDEPVRKEAYKKDAQGNLIIGKYDKPEVDKANRTGEVVYTFRKVVMQARIYIRQFDLYTPWQFGSAGMDDYADDLGDAFKKALTDALTKVCGNYLEIGTQVFKGNPDDQRALVISKFTAEEEERFKREYLNEVYGSTDVPESMVQAVQDGNPQPGVNEPAKTEIPESPSITKKVPDGMKKVDEAPAPQEQAAAPEQTEPKTKPDIEIITIPEDPKIVAAQLEKCTNAQAIKEVLSKVGIDIDAIDMDEFTAVTGAQRRTKNSMAQYVLIKYAKGEVIEPEEEEEVAPPEEEVEQAKEESDLNLGIDDEEEKVAFDSIDAFEAYKADITGIDDVAVFKDNYKEIWAKIKSDEVLTDKDKMELKDLIQSHFADLKARK